MQTDMTLCFIVIFYKNVRPMPITALDPSQTDTYSLFPFLISFFSLGQPAAGGGVQYTFLGGEPLSHGPPEWNS